MARLEEDDQGDMLLEDMPAIDRIRRLEGCVMHLQNKILDLSQALAEKEYGRPLVQSAFAEASQIPGMIDTFANTPHPFGELMTWYAQRNEARS